MGLSKNIITFEASGRVEKKIAEFEDLREEYEGLYSKMEKKRQQVNSTLERVIEVKMSSVQTLKKINEISENLKGKDREFLYHKIGDEVENIRFERIEETISNAGGIAVGAAVLGGLVAAIPALVLTGVFSHLKANQQINEIESKMRELLRGIDQLHDNLLKLDLIEKRSQELIVSIKKAQEVFQHELKVVYKQIYLIPYFSKWVKTLRRRLLRRNYFSDQDLQNIARIGAIANEFATLIDTKVFD